MVDCGSGGWGVGLRSDEADVHVSDFRGGWAIRCVRTIALRPWYAGG